MLLILVTCVAYANAWPDALVLDDASFAVADRFAYLVPAEYLAFFTQDLWAASGVDSGLYRPLLLVSVALDALVFGDWAPGYHLVNILLHVIATVIIYGLCRRLLRENDIDLRLAVPASFLAALVFAVHPIHAEVVNSIFNRSEILVSIGITGGLWWFLHVRKTRLNAAWLGLSLVYLLVLMCKESGVVLPALAVVLIWMTGTERPREKLRQSLPVLLLLVPLTIYLLLRGNALSQSITGVDDAVQGALSIDPSRMPDVILVWFESLKLLVWPHPLRIFHPSPVTPYWLAIPAQLALLLLAILAWLRGHKGLLLGLVFFYIALAPSSRIIAEPGMLPHVAERYLYLPSVGLALLIGLEYPWLVRKFGSQGVQAVSAALLVCLLALTWDRNQDWTDPVRLAEADYAKSADTGRVVETLVEALLAQQQYARASQVCDQTAPDREENWFLSNSCGVAYYHSGRPGDAERALLDAVEGQNEASARFNLAGIYLKAGRRVDAEFQFAAGIEAETVEFIRAYRQAEMLTGLYPKNRVRLLEARNCLEIALQLQPQFFQARRKLLELNRLLGLNT